MMLFCCWLVLQMAASARRSDPLRYGVPQSQLLRNSWIPRRGSFNLEELNRLEVFDRTDATEIQGPHNVLVTGPGHPYVDHFWPPGHIVGYEHTFVATLADFLEKSLAADRPFHPNFDDGAEVQKLLDAVENSANSKSWRNPVTLAEAAD